MKKEQALEFVKGSAATHFRYGDLSYLTSKRDALQDIQNIDNEAWGDGDVIEAHEYDNLLASSGVYEVTTSSDRDSDHTVTILAPSASEAEKVALGMDFGHGFPTDAVATLVRKGLTEEDFDGQHNDLEEYVEKYSDTGTVDGKELVEIADGLRTCEGLEENLKDIENIKSYACEGMGIDISSNEAAKIQKCLSDWLANENGESITWDRFVVWPLTE